MARKLEIWVESAAAWRELRLNAAGEPVYVSNGAPVGLGMRITRVVDAAPVNNPPIAGNVSFTGVVKNG